MSYINSYIQESNAADEILMEARSGGTSSVSGVGLVKRPSREEDFSLELMDPRDITVGYMSFIKDIFSSDEAVSELKKYLEEETGEEAETTRPRSREDFYESTGLTEDPEFMAQLGRMKEKYPGLSESEVFRVIKGESSFNPSAQNKDTNATGLFQFMPTVLGELGFTTDDILGMAPAEQLKVYEKYLDKWNYSGNNSLGIMQAAPAYANASEDTVVYSKGSKAWEVNPGWRPADGGDITVKSINAYYGHSQ